MKSFVLIATEKHTHNMDVAQEAVQIWIPIERDSDGYPGSEDWEQLWSWPVEIGYRIDNIPFFAKGISFGDIVAAKTLDQNRLRFEKVLLPSGSSTFRIWLAEADPKRSEEVLKEMRDLGCRAELTLGQLIAIDAGPDIEERVWQHLQSGLREGYWDLQVGCSPG